MEFAVFDIETRIDKQLINQAFFADEKLTDEEAYARYRAEGGARGSDFPELTLHIPISIAVGTVGSDYALHAIASLALTDYSEERLVREFWQYVDQFTGTLVSFNGRRFDLPVLELAALRYGIPAPNYFAENGTLRTRGGRHLDLYDFLGNFGATGLRGGLNLLLKMIGMPGKTEIDGSMVQDCYDAGQLGQIHRYCRNDVIQTYFLFIRIELMRGRIPPAAYRDACADAKALLAEDPEPHPVKG